MGWSGQRGFAGSPTVQFLVDGAQAGLLKSYGPLSFLKVCASRVYDLVLELNVIVDSTFANFISVILQVNGAGHMVPMDQPKAALEMLKRWMEGNLTVTRKGDNVSLH